VIVAVIVIAPMIVGATVNVIGPVIVIDTVVDRA
jgi:hypothetical protein